jgi:D-alanyl-D-alanine endopeptidase (penicillin-binding protein 7)
VTIKNFLFALLAIALLTPTAEAAKSHRTGKAVSGKALRSVKVVKKPVRAKKVVAAKPLIHRVHAGRVVAADIADFGGRFDVKSAAALVIEQGEGRTLYAKNIDAVQPIASITKLMTAMVVLDAGLDLHEQIAINDDDLDLIKHTGSRLRIGTILEREELLRLALMASENRAASALGRAYPGGRPAFVAAMNQKAADLGMVHTHFVDSNGLSSDNVSTAQDLAKMVTAAYGYPLIQEYTTTPGYVVRTNYGRMLSFRNTNGLVREGKWQIDVSKTGYIAEAGRCLVMQARIAAKPVIIVLLDSTGKYTRIGDANRIKRWIESPITHVSG